MSVSQTILNNEIIAHQCNKEKKYYFLGNHLYHNQLVLFQYDWNQHLKPLNKKLDLDKMINLGNLKRRAFLSFGGAPFHILL